MYDPKITQYRAAHRKYLRLLGFHVLQTPPELGEAEQTVIVELLSEDLEERLTVRFLNVCQLEIQRIHPGCLCYLEIVNVGNDQLEGLRYRVSNPEQDLTISFYCLDFELTRSSLTS